MNKLIPTLAILLLLASCSPPKTVTITKNSADGKTVVTVFGKKEASLGPFRTTVTVKSGDIPEGSLVFDVYADDLNDKNVRFDWSDSQHAIITFTQTDDSKRIFQLSVSDTHVILAPVNPGG